MAYTTRRLSVEGSSIGLRDSRLNVYNWDGPTMSKLFNTYQ